MSPNLRRSAPILLFSLLLATPSLAAAPEAKPQDLHGKWKLNEDLTARMRESEGQGRSGGGRLGAPGGMRRPPGGIGGGPGGRRPGGPGGPGGGPPPINELTIEQTAQTVTFTDAAGRKRVLYTDNRKVRETEGPAGPSEVRARWDQNGSLVVEVKPDQGPERTETWLVSKDRKLLYLTVEMKGAEGGREFAMRRAYDAAPAGEAKTAKPPAG